MLPWEVNAIAVGGILFVIVCLFLVVAGTTTGRRFWGVFAQVCIVIGVMRAAWPAESKAAVGRLAQLPPAEARIADHYLELQKARFDHDVLTALVNQKGREADGD